MEILTITLALVLSIAVALTWFIYLLWRRTLSELRAVRSSSQSLSTRYGQMTEQFMPFVPNYPWDPERFRFVGSPIDGIQFEDDKIIIVEFKASSSRLTTKQRRIRDQVKEGRVEFKEIRIDLT